MRSPVPLGLVLAVLLGTAAGAQEDAFPLDDAATLARIEFNGDLEDESGAGHPATLMSGTFTASDHGSALVLDRPAPSTDPIGFDWSDWASLLTPPFTIELVLTDLSSTNGYRKILGPDDAADTGWYFTGAEFRSYPYSSPAPLEGLPKGVPFYLALVVRAGDPQPTVEVWSGGTKLGSAPSFAAPPTDAIFFRDDSVTGRAEQFEGEIDALRISSAARTSSEIRLQQSYLFGLFAVGFEGSCAVWSHWQGANCLE
jgi:hypothetical protein